MKRVKPVHIDGTLYVSMAVFLAIQSYFTSEEAYKYVNPYAIFWIKGVCAVVGAAAGALKMFRSRTYADSQKADNSSLTSPPSTGSVRVEPENKPKL